MTDAQRAFLAGSKEFQTLISSDPVLADLSKPEIDRGEELRSLMEMLGGLCRIGKVDVQPITPAVWAFLWGIENAYTGELKDITEVDTDIFLYLLSHGIKRLDCEIAEIPAKAAGFCQTAGLEYPEAAQELVQMIHTAFRPLELLPPGGDGERAAYDADWLARICSEVARETGMRAPEIAFGMPLSACCSYYVNALRRVDVKGMIRRRTPGETAREIVRRAEELGEIFLKDQKTGEL